MCFHEQLIYDVLPFYGYGVFSECSLHRWKHSFSSPATTIVLVKQDSKGKLYYESLIENHPLSMKIFPGPDNKASFSLNLSYSRSDIISLLNGIEFLRSLCILKRIKIIDLTNKKEYVTDLGATTSFQIDDSMLNLIRTLGAIQQKTGQILRFP